MITFIRNTRRFAEPHIDQQVDQYMRLKRVAIAAFVCGLAGTVFVALLESIGTRLDGRGGVVLKRNRMKIHYREI